MARAPDAESDEAALRWFDSRLGHFFFPLRLSKKPMPWDPSEGFLITMVGAISALIVSGCMCILKSRCTRLRFGCIEIERSVLHADDLNKVDLTPSGAT